MITPKYYDSKPTAVLAMQYVDESSVNDIQQWVGEDPDGGSAFTLYNAVTGDAELYVAASDARCHLFPGDWIAKELTPGMTGFYPIKSAAFEARYDLLTNHLNAKNPRTSKVKGS